MKPAMVVDAQKLIDVPPSSPGKLQQVGYSVSVQSLFVLQIRKTFVPEQLMPRFVGQAALVSHANVVVPVVQLGMVPPVMGVVAQQIGAALVHVVELVALVGHSMPASAPPLEPPLLLPPLDPPELPPLELPLLEPLPLLPPAPVEGVELLLHAAKTRQTPTEARARMRRLMGDSPAPMTTMSRRCASRRGQRQGRSRCAR
jgi:hypothetical protein